MSPWPILRKIAESETRPRERNPHIAAFPRLVHPPGRRVKLHDPPVGIRELCLPLHPPFHSSASATLTDSTEAISSSPKQPHCAHEPPGTKIPKPASPPARKNTEGRRFSRGSRHGRGADSDQTNPRGTAAPKTERVGSAAGRGEQGED
jgi:hypothetical protein